MFLVYFVLTSAACVFQMCIQTRITFGQPPRGLVIPKQKIPRLVELKGAIMVHDVINSGFEDIPKLVYTGSGDELVTFSDSFSASMYMVSQFCEKMYHSVIAEA